MEIAVVTGTSTGIGFATSLRLARHGYRVFAGMRNLGKAEPLRAAAAEARLPVEVIPLDVTSAPSVRRAFETVAGHGPVDVLVNNAGIGGATPLELTPEDEHRRMFDTNYFGAICCIQAVLPAMRERRRGTIVNVTSIAGRVATPNQIAYSASKWALECAGEALAHEVRRFGVRVVNVEPGVVMTSIFENSAEATRYDKTSPYQPIMRRNGKLRATSTACAGPSGRTQSASRGAAPGSATRTGSRWATSSPIRSTTGASSSTSGSGCSLTTRGRAPAPGTSIPRASPCRRPERAGPTRACAGSGGRRRGRARARRARRGSVRSRSPR